MFSDLQRSSGYFGVPLTAPANFPINTILAQRLLTVTKQSKPDHLEDLSRTLWKNLWGGAGGDITRPEDLLKCCVQVGISADEAKGLLESTQEQAVKDALKDVTEDAVKRGAFGGRCLCIQGLTDSSLSSRIFSSHCIVRSRSV